MPKLPKGMFRRGPSFYVRLWQEGQDRWVCLGDDFREAKETLKGVRRGETPVRGGSTVREVAERWLKLYVPTARGEKQARMSATRVSKYLAEFMGYKPLVAVKPDDFREYRLWLEGQELKPLTVMHLLSDARCFFNWCVDMAVLDKSPFPRRVMPRIQEQPPDRLTDEEVEAVLGIPEPHAFVVRLALGTGLRWGELTRAQAAHVEQGMVVVSQTKSGRLRRVPLSPELLRETRGRVGRLVGYSWKLPGSFANVVRRASGVGRFHVHQLRHTFACRWVEQGGNLAALQQVMGHASIVTTQRYARLSDDAVRREAERLACGAMR
jgi:integrase